MALMTDLTEMRFESADYLAKYELEEMDSVEEFNRYYSPTTHEVIMDGSFNDTVTVFKLKDCDPPRF